MSNELSNNSENLAIRNDKGQLLPGVVLNPAGKPKGARHLSTILLEAIKRVSDDKGSSDDIEIVKALVTKAKSGDTKAIDIVFDRIEGKAPQKLEVDINDEETKDNALKIKALTEKLNALHGS